MRRVLVQVRLLGGFAVDVGGRSIPAEAWSRRHAAALVKLLALAPEARLHRDRVVDVLWPDVTMDAALPRLHKAAHFARRALGDSDAVVLKGEVVALFPGATLEVDAIAFEAAADAALAATPTSPETCAELLGLAGELLPDDLGEPCFDEPRERLRRRTITLLRRAQRWEDLLRLDPIDEEAHVELLRESVRRRDRAEGLRRFARMEQVLASELGISPPPEALVLRERLLIAGLQERSRPASGTDDAVPARVEGPILLEREDDLNEMEAAVRAAVDEGHGVVILVAGEAGAGKSALVRGFLDRLGSDVAVYLGGCDDLLAPRSLGPFRDMADEHPQLLPVLALDQLDDALREILRVFGAQPSVIVLEDVHWADDATLDAIRFLARRVPGIPGALVLTFRDSGVHDEQPLRRLLGSLAGSQIRRVVLAPLTVDAVRRLGSASHEGAREIHRVTQGNPFFVTEVLAAGGDGVPPTVRDAVLARLAGLPASVRTLLERLSVVPTRAERRLAETLAEGHPAAVLAAERSGMLLGGEATVSFRHELARQAIETSLTAGERVQANGLVVDALLADPAVEVSRLIHHAERSGRVDVILEHGPRAALEAVRLGAHRQAADLLRVVLDHRARLGAREVAELLTRRGYSLYLVNEYEAALESAEAGVAAAEDADDPLVLADALTVLARVVLFARGPLRCRLAAARAVAVLESADDDARLASALTESARAHSNLATVSIVADADQRSELYAERALALARQLDRKDIEAQAWCYLGDARLSRGDERGEEDLRRAIAVAESDSRDETRVRCLVNAAHGAYRSGRMDDAERLVAAGLQASADWEFFAGQYRLRLTAAAVHTSRGEWDRAVADLSKLVEMPGDPGVMASLARSMLARLLARRGDPEAAGEVLAAALAEASSGDDGFVVGPVAVAQVELGWLDGTLGEMTEDAQRALELADAAGHRSGQAELTAYLRRAGIDTPDPTAPPGPWEPTIARRWQEAAAAWAVLGERYERALVLARAPDRAPRAEGLEILQALGARATLMAV
jgi:DNA-binding SARP family transcriptional activator/tetratricopeptide (TPR) repeat protein